MRVWTPSIPLIVGVVTLLLTGCSPADETWLEGRITSRMSMTTGRMLPMEGELFFSDASGARYRLELSDSTVTEGRRPGPLELNFVADVPARIRGRIADGTLRATHIDYVEPSQTSDPPSTPTAELTTVGVAFGTVGSRQRGLSNHAMLLWDGDIHYELEFVDGSLLEGRREDRASVFDGMGQFVYEVAGEIVAEGGRPVLRVSTMRYLRDATDDDRAGAPPVSGKYSTHPRP